MVKMTTVNLKTLKNWYSVKLQWQFPLSSLWKYKSYNYVMIIRVIHEKIKIKSIYLTVCIIPGENEQTNKSIVLWDTEKKKKKKKAGIVELQGRQSKRKRHWNNENIVWDQ